MPEKDSDPAASTAAFQAYAEKVDTEQPRSRSGLTVFAIVLALLVVAAAIAYVLLG